MWTLVNRKGPGLMWSKATKAQRSAPALLCFLIAFTSWNVIEKTIFKDAVVLCVIQLYHNS